MRKYLLAFTAGLIFLCGGCSNNPVTTSTGTTYTITSVVSFSILPSLPAGGVLLYAQTQNSYNHSDYVLEYSLSEVSNTISLAIVDAHEPPSGATSAPAPAAATINLGILDTGTYSLAIAVNSVTQNMILTVTDTSYAITNGNGSWTSFAAPLIEIVPVYTIWGEFTSGSPSWAGIASSFIDSLDTMGAVARTYTPGNYGYFVIDSAGQIVDQNTTSIFHSAFVLQYTGVLQSLRSLTQEFGNSVINITMYAYDGEEFSSSTVTPGGITRPKSVLSVLRR